MHVLFIKHISNPNSKNEEDSINDQESCAYILFCLYFVFNSLHCLQAFAYTSRNITSSQSLINIHTNDISEKLLLQFHLCDSLVV